MTRNGSPPSSSGAPSGVTTETFQKHYGRGSGYPADPSHHSYPPPPPHNYQPHYASGQHQHAPPPSYPPPGHGHRGGPPPAQHGYHHPSWYYPPHAPVAAARTASAPTASDPSSEMVASSSPSRRDISRGAKKINNVPPSLVTPKSHDSETLPPVAADTNKVESKKPPAKSSNKKTINPKRKIKKERSDKLPSSNNDKELEMEEEPKVEPMKQDFHFYATDHYEDAKQECQQQLENSLADGSIPEKNNENQLYLLTTLLNARLIQNWEAAPPSTRAEYLKKEEGDRKRFMSEEEVASRHCATLTARRRSPKQSGGLGRMGSFGLASAVEVTSSSSDGVVARSEKSMKRPSSDFDADVPESSAKRLRVV